MDLLILIMLTFLTISIKEDFETEQRRKKSWSLKKFIWFRSDLWRHLWHGSIKRDYIYSTKISLWGEGFFISFQYLPLLYWYNRRSIFYFTLKMIVNQRENKLYFSFVHSEKKKISQDAKIILLEEEKSLCN